MTIRLSSGGPAPRKRLGAAERRELIEHAATEVFAKRGYQDTTMEEIARCSGVSVPVLYDHFESKQALHGRLLERHFAGLRAAWGPELLGKGDADQRIARTIDALFAFVQAQPYACRLLFRESSGDSEAAAIHRRAAAQSWDLVLQTLSGQIGAENLASAHGLVMVGEILRTGLQGLALWWSENPRVPRTEVVDAAMNVLWTGLERMRNGQLWNSSE
ncbi:MAG: TetR/AcrR family transcriptional regulator [Nevskia sp.]|nr:TetR/AcrR family transcriptional regulator [Nevskia sp.]